MKNKEFFISQMREVIEKLEFDFNCEPGELDRYFTPIIEEFNKLF